MMFPDHSSTMSSHSSGSTNSGPLRDRLTGITHLSLNITLDEMYFGTTCIFDCLKELCDYCEPSSLPTANDYEDYSLCEQCHNMSVRTTTRKRKVQINPGTRPMQTITFAPKDGFRDNAYVFTLHALDHSTFQLQGDDLVMVMHLDLVESLCGFDKVITTLGKRKVPVSVPKGKVITNSSEMCIKGEGMPMYKQNHLRGDLIIRFKVGYPAKIAAGCLENLEKCLPARPNIEIPLEAEEKNLMNMGTPAEGSDYELLEDNFSRFYKQIFNGQGESNAYNQ